MISVIVPVYNTEKFLHRCLDSILGQSFQDIELLLINDGSTDNSGTICNNYAKKDRRVSVFHKENGGVSSARNVGLDNARGEYVTFVDSDDWVCEGMYQEMYEKAKKESADVVYCDINMVFELSQKKWRAARYESSKVDFLNNFISSEWTSLCNLLVRRTLIEENNIRNPEGFHFAEDYHVACHILLFANKISYVPEALYCYNRVNEKSALHTFSPDQYEKERQLNLNVIAFFEKEGVYKDYAKVLNWRLLKSTQEYILDKEYDKFLSIHPDSLNYIWSCPYLNVKIKIMMWALAHNLIFIVELLLFIRDVRIKLSGHK